MDSDETAMKDHSENFKDFLFEDIEDLGQKVLGYHSKREGKKNNRTIEGRKRIAEFSTAYLKKISKNLPEGMENKVMEKIELLKRSDPENIIILMAAHQPNLFAYPGVLKKIALLKALEKQVAKHSNKPVVCFYGIADQDFVHNKWVRSAEMRAPLRKEGVLRFNIDLPKKDLFLPTNRIEKPSIGKLDSWKAQVDSWMSENCSLAMKYSKSSDMDAAEILDIAKNNFEKYWEYVSKAQDSATNLAEFSSFILATIANSVFDTPIVFANFSDCFTAFGNEYEFLVSKSDEYSEVVEEDEKLLKSFSIDSGLSTDVSELLPIWVNCKCGSKYKMTTASNGFHGECMNCDIVVEYTKKELIELIKTSPQLIQPRSISMLLAFSSAIEPSCYIGGKGGLGYLRHTKAVGRKFGIRLPPISYWDSPDEYTSIEALAAAWEIQRISTTYGLAKEKILTDSVAKIGLASSKELNKKMEDGLIPKTAVSERERQLLEKVPASLKIPSCSIGYSINIGIGSAYSQWVDFLINGGKLKDTVKLSSILG